MKELCIDISSWQAGIDYEDIKRNCKYAVLRAGFGDSDIDSRFEEHYANLHNDLHLGAYWYSYATSPEGARNEARLFIQTIGDKQFDLPIYLDIEDASMSGLGTETLNAIVEAFGDEIQKAGYYFGVYSNLYWYTSKLSGNYLNSKFDWWIALWDSDAPDPAYAINYGIWQFGSVSIGGQNVDGNYIYKDYPKIIRELGLNHLSKDSDFMYQGHVEDIGWQNPVSAPKMAGTTGESKRLEAIRFTKIPFDIYAKAHMQDLGWVDYGKINEDTIIGTTGESRRLEDLCFKGDFEFRVHIEGTGWTPWTKADGVATLGTVGQSLRIEAIECRKL